MAGTSPAMMVEDLANNLRRRDLRRERSGRHQPVRLLNDIAGFRIFRQEVLPVRILHHLGTLLLAVAGTLIDPAMHQRVELPGFTDKIVVRLAHVAKLHRIGELAVEIELCRYPAWKNP